MRTRGEGDTVQLSKVRIKESLRAALQRDAEAQQITLNAAIANRLQRSFDEELAYGGPRLAALFRRLAADAEFRTNGAEWLDDRLAFNQVEDGWLRYLKEIKPPPEGEFQEQVKQHFEYVKNELKTADAARAKTLRTAAAFYTFDKRMDPEIRAQWEALATTLTDAEKDQ